MADPPDWLIAARRTRGEKHTKPQRRRERNDVARRLGVAVRAVKEHDVAVTDIDGLFFDPPEWLEVEQQRHQAQIDRRAKDALGRELTDTLIASVHDVWFAELKYATTDADVDTIDARRAREVGRAKRQARRLVDELTVEQVRARIEREDQAARGGAVHRATQLVPRASGGGSGR